MSTARTRTRRAAILAAAVLLMASLVTLATALPAAAHHGLYQGTRSPLSHSGTPYDDALPDQDDAQGAIYIGWDTTFEEFGTEFIDGDDPRDVGGFSGDDPVNVGLATMELDATTRYVTFYVAGEIFDQESASLDCTGFEAVLTAVYEDEYTDTCVGIKAAIFTANGHGNDYSFTDYTGFTDDGGGPLGGGDPTLTAGMVAPAITFDPALYQTSRAPFTYNGTDYTQMLVPGSGTMWFAPGPPPVFVTADDTALPGFPSTQSGPAEPVQVVLAQIDGVNTTIYLDGALFTLFSQPTDCAGAEAVFADVFEGGTCDAFRADLWTPGASEGSEWTCAEDYQTRWTDGNGDEITDPMTVVDGTSAPALTTYGSNTGTGVCTVDTGGGGGTTTTTATPGTTGENTGGSDGTTDSTPTLPATGTGSLPIAWAASGLLGLGLAAAAVARSQARRAPR